MRILDCSPSLAKGFFGFVYKMGSIVFSCQGGCKNLVNRSGALNAKAEMTKKNN